MARVAVGGFQHETNSFAPAATTFETFAAADGWPGLTRGTAVFDALEGYNIGMAGLLEGARAEGWDVVPLAWCGGGAGGTVTEEAFEAVSALLLEALEAALPLDGLLLDLHGAMAAAHLDDGDGEFLRRVRTFLGPDVPVVCSLDLHANLSAEMVDLADLLLACRTYPHLDMAETGRRAARHLARILAGERPGRRAFRQIPFLIHGPRGCTLAEPARSVYQALADLEARPGVTSLSFACGFPPSDVPHCGPAILGYGTDAAALEAAVEALYGLVLAREADFALDLWGVEAAVRHARETAAPGRGPVILADVDDNAGGGEASDTMWIFAELVRQGAENAAVGVIRDPAAVALAREAGVGATVRLGLGGKSGRPGDRPCEGDFLVEALSDGRFRSTGVYFAGGAMDLGPMALLRLGGVRAVVSTRREQAADRAMFAHLGLDPAAVGILALKSTAHYRADFQPIAAGILEVGAPDRNGDPLRPYLYRNLRPGLRMVPGGPAFG